MTEHTETTASESNVSSGRRVRPWLIMGALVLLIVLVIGGVKFVQISRLIAESKTPLPPAVVTATPAQYAEWLPAVTAIGSMKAFRGVEVTTEIAGIVRGIDFKSGQDVGRGAQLLQLNADSDLAQLRSLEASEHLAATVLERDRAQLKEGAISQAQFDADEADWRVKVAAVAQQRAQVQKKSIVAPFAGRIGITSVNPGQYLNPGDKVATLTTLDPILVNFNVPQGQKAQIATGQVVTLTVDGLTGRTFRGKVSAIDTKVDQTTRNVLVEALVPNPGRELLPGMFARVSVASGKAQQLITIPQTAITVNPYGTTVFVVDKGGDAKQAGSQVARQVFVQTGATRGDQIAVLSGVKEGETVVTSGQMKLKNGMAVKIDNSAAPANDPAPTPQEQ